MQKRFWYDLSRKMVIGELITDFNVSLTGPIFDWFSASFDLISDEFQPTEASARCGAPSPPRRPAAERAAHAGRNGD
jgi:hypothetical protein